MEAKGSSDRLKQWKAAALRARGLTDPWAKLGFDNVKEESVTRHMYNPRNGKWKMDEVVVKVQSEVLTHTLPCVSAQSTCGSLAFILTYVVVGPISTGGNKLPTPSKLVVSLSP